MMIGLIGKAGSGKSSVADILVKNHGYLRYSMAGAMRKALLAAMPFLEGRYLHEDKQSIIPGLGVTGRQLLQTFGHDWGRTQIHKGIWIQALQSELSLMKVDFRKVVIDDMRYENECDWVKNSGGTIIGIDRPSLDTDEMNQEWRKHQSENGISDDMVDTWIANISCYWSDLELAVEKTLTAVTEPQEAMV
jgi:hypothetical protein